MNACVGRFFHVGLWKVSAFDDITDVFQIEFAADDFFFHRIGFEGQMIQLALHIHIAIARDVFAQGGVSDDKRGCHNQQHHRSAHHHKHIHAGEPKRNLTLKRRIVHNHQPIFVVKFFAECLPAA